MEAAAFKLKNDGEISPLFQTKDGIEILQRVSRKSAAYKPLSAVQAEVTAAVRQALFNRIFAADMERIQHEVKQSPEALAQFAQSKGAKRVDLTNAQLGKNAQAAHRALVQNPCSGRYIGYWGRVRKAERRAWLSSQS